MVGALDSRLRGRGFDLGINVGNTVHVRSKLENTSTFGCAKFRRNGYPQAQVRHSCPTPLLLTLIRAQFARVNPTHDQGRTEHAQIDNRAFLNCFKTRISILHTSCCINNFVLVSGV